jgi:hypothetical protein
MNWTKHLATAVTVIGLTATAFSVQAQTLRLAVTDIVGLETCSANTPVSRRSCRKNPA